MKIFVTAKTGAKEGNVKKVDDTHYQVAVKERPIKGKANNAIRKILAAFFKIPQSNIILHSGAFSKQKVFRIVD